MSNFPNDFDDDTTLPFVNNNITEIGDEVVNALRDATVAIEYNIGIGAAGSTLSIAERLGVSLYADGYIKPSALTALGLVTLPITESQIAVNAAIPESKLNLDHSTQDLYNYITNLSLNANSSSNWISSIGSKLNPHLSGSIYRHTLDQIDVTASPSNYLNNRFHVLRDNSQSYNLIKDLNNELLAHQWSDGSTASTGNIVTSNGSTYPSNYAHTASGVFLNTSRFATIPQSSFNLQLFAEFVDNASIFLLGTRIQNLYASGVSRASRSGSLTNTTNGQSVIPSTTVNVYLLDGYAGAPVDNIDTGDDIIEFLPASGDLTSNSFESKFSLVRAGDSITVNYGSFTVPNIILEKKSISSGPNKRFLVRINRKNLMDGYFTAHIDKPLFNTNKYGVLALGQANAPFTALPSIIVGSPRGAQALGLGFNPDQIDTTHYNLWLAFYPTGNPLTSRQTLAKIDVSGNKGVTPGKYTLDSIVEATNNNFRKAGYNYRFIAFSYKGNFGIMLADPYGNAGFSVISGIITSSGLYDNALSKTVFINNVLGVPGFDDNDALGIGPNKAAIASPTFSTSFANSAVAQVPTKVFLPLSRNNYYVNGVERERFNLESGQSLDTFGDGYWSATITSKLLVPGVREEITYRVDADLTDARIRAGKTLVVQSSTGIVDSGRYFIKDVQFTNCPGANAFTNVVVYDGIHGTGASPYLSAPVGTVVGLYFNSDSIGFNVENASDFTTISTPFKRSFELYVDQDGNTFPHERARFSTNSTSITVNEVDLFTDSNLTNLNIHKISPKLKGYKFFPIVKINLAITSFNQTTGIFSGYLRRWDGSTESHLGQVVTGKKGDVVRFYDETNIDYIDIIFSLDDSVPTITTTKHIDIQIFPSLSLNDEVMLLGICQVNDTTKKIQYLQDERQFGNVSESQLSTSALDYISAPTKLISENGIIRGFEIDKTLTGDFNNVFRITGGTAIVNGKVVKANDELLTIPIVRETLYPSFSVNITTTKWFLCINENGAYEFVASSDYDPAGSFNSSYVAASLDHTRLMYVKNPNNPSGTTYSIKGTYFSDLLINHRNLTPLAVITTPIIIDGLNYVINPTVGTGNTVFEDARRFIANGYSGLSSPFTFGTNASFRTFESLNAWLTNLNKYKSASGTLAGDTGVVNKIGDTVLVKDSVNVSGKAFDFGRKVKFIGDGGRFVITTAATMKNIHLENLRIDTTVGSAITFSGVQNNMTQCYFTATVTNPIRIATLSSIRFTDNVFTSSGVALNFIDNSTSGTLTVMALGNVYTAAATLISGGTVLPASVASYNAADGA